MGEALRIGDLARIGGVTPRTIRHYESLGLLPLPNRGPSGYREYEPTAVVAIAEIRRLRALGMSLSDIADARRGAGSTSLGSRLQDLKKDIDKQSAQLADRRRALESIERGVASGEAVIGAGEPPAFAAVRCLLSESGATEGAIDEARRVFAALESLALPDEWIEMIETGLALIRRDERMRGAWIGALEVAAELRDMPVDDPAVAKAARRIAALAAPGDEARSAVSFKDPLTVAIVTAVASCFGPAQIAAFVTAAAEVGAFS